MTNMEFAEQLTILAKQHENDEVSIFGTPWSKICYAAAATIINLDKDLRSANEELAAWWKWYSENEVQIVKAAQRSNEVNIPKLEDEPAKPTKHVEWDGVRRDIDDLPIRDLKPIIKEDEE